MMDNEDYPAWQDEFRVASRKEDVEFVVAKVKHYSQHQLYTKIRQLDEWCETLDSRQGALQGSQGLNSTWRNCTHLTAILASLPSLMKSIISFHLIKCTLNLNY